MAQPAVVQANGVPGPEQVESPQSLIPVKRKRDDDDRQDHDVDASEVSGRGDDGTATNGIGSARDKAALIQAYLRLLETYDTEPSILRRALPEAEARSAEEPQTKRQKSDGASSSPTTIADKVVRDEYHLLEHLARDIVSAVNEHVIEIQSLANESGDNKQDFDAIARAFTFRDQALEHLRRELAYPHTSSQAHPKSAARTVLAVFGNAPQGKQLFSSLPRQIQPAKPTESSIRPLDHTNLPRGVSSTIITPAKLAERRVTLGDVFPQAKKSIPLQLSKAPKSHVKGSVLSFYHPQMTDNSPYRTNTYFSQRLALGHFLDYTNATPSSQIKTKQRERAQSLAGHKPSTTELEMTEMEALFRGAFSSFAPCKDDSAAVVPASLAGRLWWQRTGHRSFNRMVDAERGAEMPSQDAEIAEVSLVDDLDEELLESAIENWDEDLVDPSLGAVMGKPKSEEEQEVEDMLQEVSDLILTLASYQQIRNGSKPQQTRYAAEPHNGDMLTNGQAPSPSEEETATYEALKAQLLLIIQTLPPYAVAKLRGDQLDELLVSTKVEVQADGYRGVMEEDEATIRARVQQQQAAPNATRQPGHRSSGTSATPYPGSGQYQPAGGQYGTPTRTPVPIPQYARSVQPSAQSQPNVLPRGIAQHQTPHPPQRPPPNQHYRPPNGYTPYSGQLAKTQTPYGHQGMPQYATGSRQQQHPGYAGVAQHTTPSVRYPGSYPQGYSQQPQGTPSHQSSYPGYTNGAMQQHRAVSSPQVAHHSQPYNAGQYQQQQQQQRYTAPAQGMPGQSGGSRPLNTSSPGHMSGTMANSPGIAGYHTVLDQNQQQRMMDQARARFAAQERNSSFGDKSQSGSPIVGLSSIGLGGNYDMARVAAAKASMPGGVGQMQRLQGSVANHARAGVNGMRRPTPPIPSKITPVPVPVIPPPPMNQSSQLTPTPSPTPTPTPTQPQPPPQAIQPQVQSENPSA